MSGEWPQVEGSIEDFLNKYSDWSDEPVQGKSRHAKDPGQATIREVSKDRKIGADAMSEEDYLSETRRADLAQKKLNRFMQRFFFWFALALIAVPVLVSAVGFTWVFVNDRMTDAIAAAFFASVVGELIGLSVILGKYLFPQNGLNGEPTKKSKKHKK